MRVACYTHNPVREGTPFLGKYKTRNAIYAPHKYKLIPIR